MTFVPVASTVRLTCSPSLARTLCGWASITGAAAFTRSEETLSSVLPAVNSSSVPASAAVPSGPVSPAVCGPAGSAVSSSDGTPVSWRSSSSVTASFSVRSSPSVTDSFSVRSSSSVTDSFPVRSSPSVTASSSAKSSPSVTVSFSERSSSSAGSGPVSSSSSSWMAKVISTLSKTASSTDACSPSCRIMDHSPAEPPYHTSLRLESPLKASRSRIVTPLSISILSICSTKACHPG